MVDNTSFLSKFIAPSSIGESPFGETNSGKYMYIDNTNSYLLQRLLGNFLREAKLAGGLHPDVEKDAKRIRLY